MNRRLIAALLAVVGLLLAPMVHAQDPAANAYRVGFVFWRTAPSELVPCAR